MSVFSLKRVMLGLFAAALLPAQSVRGAGYGLMVGIDRYDPAYVSNPLNSCVNDANAFRQKLTADASRWPAANFTTLTDAAATKSALRNKLASLAATAVAGDVVLYFQSSHGGQNSGADTFLCTYNASYQDEELAADLSAFQTGVNVIIVIDACFSAGMFKAPGGAAAAADTTWNFAQNVMTKMQALKAARGAVAKGPGIGWITAADYNEYSLAGSPYSLFVSYVFEGFQYGDADSNGQVSFLELYNYATPLAIAEAAQYSNPQHPQALNTSLLEATVAKGTVVEPLVSLADALDETNLTWTTAGSASWYGQTAVTYDGADAGRSGLITHSQQTWFEAAVTGPGALSYAWKVSSEKNYDFLKFIYDGVAQGAGISGETNWTTQAWAIPAGSHTVRWLYAKDSSVSSGSDCAWVDQVVWLQGYTVTFDPEGGTVSPTSKTVYRGAAYGELPTPARANHLFAGWWTGDNGTGSQVTGGSALAVSADHTLHAKWTELITLGVAVEAPEETWTTGGATNWFGQRLTAQDGADAAQSGPVAHSQQTWMQTAVAGPVTVSFWWKVSSEAGHDSLAFSIDGVEQAGKISGEVGWQQKSYLLSGGAHTLKWAYAKDGATSSGSDCGWVDQVGFSQGAASFSQEAVTTAGEGDSGEGEYSAQVPVWGEGPVSVTVSAVPASATAADYAFSASGAVLSWASGESGVKHVTVPIKGDTAAEGNELFYLALGSPSGGAVGATGVCAVVIADDDGSAPETGPYVSGVAVPPEGGGVAGGGYCPAGKTVSLTASAAAGWTFLGWENGYQGSARSVTAAEAAGAAANGAMRCVGSFKRTAEVAPPSASSPGPQEAVVGVGLSLPLPIASECLPKVTASGLPSGLAVDASTARIVGVPKAAGAYTVTFTASNAGGAAAAQSFVLTVIPLPAWAQGTFNGFYRIPDGAGGASDGGPASMTVTAQGKVTGKLSFRGTNYTFSAASFAERTSGGSLTLQVTAKSVKATLPLAFDVWRLADSCAGGCGLPATLGAAQASTSEGWLELYRNVWKDAGMSSELAQYVGYYTATLPGNDSFGSGYLTLTVDAYGTVKTSGKLADGTSVSMSGPLLWGTFKGAVLYNVPLAYKGGRFFGLVEFVKPADGGACYLRPLEDGGLLWKSLNPQATATYRAGFQRSLGLAGGWYDKVGNLYSYYAGRVLAAGADAGAPAPEITVGGTRYASAWWNPDGVVLAPVLNSLGVMTGLKAPAAGKPVSVDNAWVYDAADNTAGLTFTLTRVTGLYRGTFKAWFDYGTTHTAKSVSFQGALTPVRETPGDGREGRGYFLWADKGSYVNAQGSTSTYSFNESYDFLILGAPAPE